MPTIAIPTWRLFSRSLDSSSNSAAALALHAGTWRKTETRPLSSASALRRWFAYCERRDVIRAVTLGAASNKGNEEIAFNRAACLDVNSEIIEMAQAGNGLSLYFKADGLYMILPSNELSFAYKSGQNTLKCFKQHEHSSNFLKLDIHHFFESIKYRRFVELFYRQIAINLKNNGLKPFELFGKEDFKKYIKALFYDGHIPLGFVSSPKVSDYYLKSVDDWAQKHKKVRYSRYADDVLFSTNDLDFSFSYVKSAFIRRIKEKGLTINDSKVMYKKLINNGDCIKFLGICLVKKNDANEIRISKHYLKEVIKECYNATDKEGSVNEAILGKVRYIKLISEKSYTRLIRALKGSEKGSTIVSKIQLSIN